MWKSLLKWIGVAVAEKAIEKVMPAAPAVESSIPRRRTREEMKEVYWAKWNKLMSIENRSSFQEKHLQDVTRWLSKYDAERFRATVYARLSGEPLA